MALKDCWMDADRTREGEIMSSIIQDATKAGSKENIQELEEGLLSVFIHGDVHIAGKLDRTLTKDQRSELFAEDDLFLVHRSDLNKKKFEALLKKGLQERAAKGSHRSKSDFIHRSNLSPIMYCPKKHYRIVFKEACKPLSQETNLCRIFFILGIVCRILKAMHETGWVHRDISIGNIMTFKNTVKLADVEDAKRIGQTTGGHHEIRTGTADFMSIEVHHMRYMFPRPCNEHAAPVRKPVRAFRDLVLQPRSDAVPAPTQDTDSPLIPWFYNPLHDMESMFWLMAYYVLFRDVYLPDSPRFPPPFAEESDAERARRIKAQFEFVQCLFVQRDLSERQALMMVHNSLSDKLKEAPLHPALRPIGVCLLQARSALHNAYTNAEKNLPILLADASSIASDLYMDFPSILHEMRQRLVDAGVGNLQGRHLSEAYGAIVVEEEERRQQKRQTVRETQTRLRRENEWNGYMAQNTIDEPAAHATGTLKRKQPLQTYAQDDSLRRSKRIASRVVQFVESDDEEDTHVRPRRRSTKKAVTSKKRKRVSDEDVADATVKPARKVARVAKDVSPVTRPKSTSRKPTAGSSTRQGNGRIPLVAPVASKLVPALPNPADASRKKSQAVDEIRPVVGRVLRPRKHK